MVVKTIPSMIPSVATPKSATIYRASKRMT